MSRKKRKRRKKVVTLPKGVTDGSHLCGFRLNPKKLNQLWMWETLEDVKF